MDEAFRTFTSHTAPTRWRADGSLTVPPEGVRLGFYILEVDVKILPGVLSGKDNDDGHHDNNKTGDIPHW